MATSIFRASDSFLIYAEDSAWGTAGTPTGGNYVDRVNSFSATVENNPNIQQGIGDGLNGITLTNGIIDVSGDISWEFTDPSFFQYLIIGAKSGSGTVGAPYKIKESSQIGYASGETKSLTLGCEKEGGSNDDAMLYDGVFFESFSLTANVGETLKCNASWTGRSASSTTSIATYAGPTNKPFNFTSGTVQFNSDTLALISSFNVNCTTELSKKRELGNRLLIQPVCVRRRYTFSGTMRLAYNDAANKLTALDVRGMVMGGTATSTAITATASANAMGTLKLNLVEGSSTGDRVCTLQFSNAFFSNFSEPVDVGNGDIEVTFSGVALSGLVDSSDKTFCSYYTI